MYYVAYRCANCLVAYIVSITDGKIAPSLLHCPNCKTDWLQKVPTSAIEGRNNVHAGYILMNGAIERK